MANPNATPDMKMAVTAPAGATCKVGFNDQETAVAVGNAACGVSSGIMTGLTAEDTYEVFGTVVNGATPGNVTLQWAQNTANAANTIVRAGSFLHADRIAGTGQTAQAFIQGGNSFGALATLGTNDNNALSIMTNGTERLRILASGESQFGDDITANRVATGTTGTTTGAGTNSTTLNLLADSFNLNDVVFIDNVGQDYYTRITVDPGTGSYTVSPAVTYTNARTVTKYTIQNIGATTTDYTSQSNRFFQGYFLGGVVVGAGSTTISDGSIDSTTTLRLQSGGGSLEVGGGLTVSGILTGDASGLTNISGASVDGSTISTLNASNISTGTIADGRLSANVALLNGGQTFSALTTFSAGLSVTGNTNTTGDITASGAISGATISGDGAGLTNLSSANLSGALPAISGANLTSLNATNISSGTLADGRLSSNIALLNGGQTFSALTAFGAGVSITGNSNITGNFAATGTISGLTISGDGSALTALNASNISSGTLADARLSSNVTLLGNTFNGINQLVRLDGSGNLPALNGSALTNLSSANLSGALPAISGANLTGLNATNISSGTLADGRLTSNVTLLGNTFNGNSQLVQLTAGGALPALNGSGLTSLSAGNLTGAISAIDGSALTSLNASNIGSGTLADGRLSSNVALLAGIQTFTGAKTFGAGLTVSAGNLSVSAGNISASGAISGATVSGDGSGLTNLSSANLSGALPAISGANLTGLNATNISSGTLADGLLSSNVALLTGTQTFSGAKTFGSGLTISSGNLAGGSADITTTGQISGTTIVGGGSGITTLNATNLSSGTVADARLSSNVVLLTGTQTISGTKTFSGGFVLGLSTLSSSAKISRAVSLPDEAGAVCISNSNNCGFLRIAAGSFQTDASVNNVLAVDKTNATGNLIEMRRSGTAVFMVGNSGALQIQSTSATALDIRNAGGTSYFSVDTSTGTVRVGPAAADGTGVLFVLDTKNTAGDPTGINGGSYYNSSTNRNRCFENGAWKDCIDQTSFTKAADQTVTNNAAFQNDTALVFAMAANSTYQVEATIPYVTTSAAADFKYTFTVPVGATITLYTDATTAVAATTICSIVASGQTCTLANTANLRGTITVHGVVTTAANAGNLQFQFAQNTATAGQSVTVFTGSSLSYRRP
jgi:hypothetical protein